MSVIVNSGNLLAAVPATKIHFSIYFNWRLISQLTNGISIVLQKLLRYFNGTISSTSFVPQFSICPVCPVWPVCPVCCCLNLKEILLLLLAGKPKILLLLSRVGLSL